MIDTHTLALTKGDRVAIVATARKVGPDDVKPAVDLLESWGLRVVIPEGLYATDNQFAGDDAHRAAVLQAMLDDPSIKAIFCARGGYGTVRILDRIDFSAFDANPKWIVGYSDVTALHSHVSVNCGLPTLHATMPINIPTDSKEVDYPSLTTLKRVLFEGDFCYKFVGQVGNREGECVAPIVGGNLSVLYSLLGSKSDVDTNGKILLIEDLDEYLYHIDRMMTALRRAGKLSGLKGLIVGSMTDMHDNETPFGHTAEEIVAEMISDYSYPVAFNCPFGHIGVRNLALPLGVGCHMAVYDNYVSIRLAE